MKAQGTLGRSSSVKALESVKAGRKGPFDSIRERARVEGGSPWRTPSLSWDDAEEDAEEVIEIPDPRRRPYRQMPLWFPYPNEFNHDVSQSWQRRRSPAAGHAARRPFGSGRPMAGSIVMPAWFTSGMTFMRFK